MEAARSRRGVLAMMRLSSKWDETAVRQSAGRWPARAGSSGYWGIGALEERGRSARAVGERCGRAGGCFQDSGDEPGCGGRCFVGRIRRDTGEPLALTGKARVFLDHDARMPVRRLRERAVRGDDELDRVSGELSLDRTGEVFVIVERARGRETRRKKQAGPEPSHSQGSPRIRGRTSKVNGGGSVRFSPLDSMARRLDLCTKAVAAHSS